MKTRMNVIPKTALLPEVLTDLYHNHDELNLLQWLENPWRGCKSRPFFKLSSSSIWLKRCDALLAVVAKINEGRWMDSRWVGGSGPLPMSVKELIEFVELKRKSDGWMDGWTVGLTFVTKWPKALVAEPVNVC